MDINTNTVHPEYLEHLIKQKVEHAFACGYTAGLCQGAPNDEIIDLLVNELKKSWEFYQEKLYEEVKVVKQ